METTVKSFLNYLGKEKKYTNNTLLSYSGDLNQFISNIKIVRNYRNINTINDFINDEMLAKYFQILREKGYSLSTIARKTASVKSLIKYLVETGKIKNDSAPNLSSPQVNKSVPKPLTISEVRLFLAEPNKLNTIESKRDRAMLELIYATGFRASELMALNTGDVDLECRNIICRKDNNQERSVAIDNFILKILEEYMNDSRLKLLNNPNEVALFLNKRGERLTRQGFWQIIQGYAEKVGLGKKVTPRSLRHSFAVHRLKSGSDLKTMQELLGHAHISTTKIYQDVKP